MFSKLLPLTIVESPMRTLKNYILSLSENKKLVLVVASVFILMLPLIFSKTEAPTDCSNYYSPMIESIAQGDWAHGYWKGIQPLFTSIAGVLAKLLKISNGFTMAKLTSAGFFCLTFIPLFKLTKNVFTEKSAWTSLGLLFCCSRLMRYAGSGLLNSGKLFFLTWIVYEIIIFKQNHSWRSSLYIAIASTGLTLIRPEGSFMGPLFIIGLFSWELCCLLYNYQAKRLNKNRSTNKLVIKLDYSRLVKIIFTGLLSLILLSPWTIYQYRATGLPVLAYLQVAPVKSLLSKVVPSVVTLSGEEAVESPLIETVIARGNNNSDKQENYKGLWDALIVELFKGFHPLYMLLYIPILFQYFIKNKFNNKQRFLLFIIFCHTLFFIIATRGTWTQKRYIIVTLPLLLGWTAIGLDNILIYSRKILPLRLIKGVLALLVIGFYLGGLKDILPLSARKEIAARLRKRSAEWIKLKGSLLIKDNARPLASNRYVYYNNKRVKICTTDPKLVYMAEASRVLPVFYDRSLTYPWFCRLCFEKQVHFILVDKQFELNYPLLKPLYKDKERFILLKTIKVGNLEQRIFGFRPSLKLSKNLQR